MNAKNETNPAATTFKKILRFLVFINFLFVTNVLNWLKSNFISFFGVNVLEKLIRIINPIDKCFEFSVTEDVTQVSKNMFYNLLFRTAYNNIRIFNLYRLFYS